MQITQTSAIQCLLSHLELHSYRLKLKIQESENYKRRSLVSNLQPFVEEKAKTCLIWL